MPYTWEKQHKKLPPELDRRRKLTDEDRLDIKRRYSEGETIRGIARAYADKCTRRVIQYTLRPELYEHLKDAFKKRRKTGRYRPSRRKWAETIREHRRYKQSVKDKLL
jgi:adenylosuccinate synthase